MKNGVTPTHAAPSKARTRTPSGSRRCTTPGSKRQCKNEMSSHRWTLTATPTTWGHASGGTPPRVTQPRCSGTAPPPYPSMTHPSPHAGGATEWSASAAVADVRSASEGQRSRSCREHFLVRVRRRTGERCGRLRRLVHSPHGAERVLRGVGQNDRGQRCVDEARRARNQRKECGHTGREPHGRTERTREQLAQGPADSRPDRLAVHLGVCARTLALHERFPQWLEHLVLGDEPTQPEDGQADEDHITPRRARERTGA